jgi:hypothetical protein
VGGGLIRIPVSGITGGNCAAGQTWTISASGNNTDSALVGNSQNQTLPAVTNFPVDSSACDGGGTPPPPTGMLASYEFDGNCNDSSGNANHATCVGTSFVTGKYGQALQTNQGEDDYADTGLLLGHNPSTTHLVIATGVFVDQADLGDEADIFGTSVGTNQRVYVYRHTTNVWRMSIQGTFGAATEFPVVSGWSHVCLKMNSATDVATLYVNGVAGALSGASTIAYTSYTLPAALRFGLPPTFGASVSGNHKLDNALVYTTDVSCADIYAAWEPPAAGLTMTQAAHQWQGVYLLGGSAENRGAVNEQRTVVKGGAVSLVAQVSCSPGPCGSLQPRFRYNVNGGGFANVVPDAPTADGIWYWGQDADTKLNSGLAGPALTGALTHTSGIRAFTSAAIPTIEMAASTSYTFGGTFRVDAAVNDVICFKLYDQSGQPLASYTPTAGACVTVEGMKSTR